MGLDIRIWGRLGMILIGALIDKLLNFSHSLVILLFMMLLRVVTLKW